MPPYMELIIDQVVRGTTEIFSAPKFDEMLGSTYDVAFEVEVEDSTGSSATIKVQYYHSNSGKAFIALSTLISPTSIDINLPLPYRAMVTQSGPTGRLGRVSVLLAGTGTLTARVRIWAVGRMRS